jgi:hypothetical protein
LDSASLPTPSRRYQPASGIHIEAGLPNANSRKVPRDW